MHTAVVTLARAASSAPKVVAQRTNMAMKKSTNNGAVRRLTAR